MKRDPRVTRYVEHSAPFARPILRLWSWRARSVVGTKSKGAMGQFGRITSLEELPPPARIRLYVRKVAALRGEAGGRPRRPAR